MKKVLRSAAMIALMFGALTINANEGKLSLFNKGTTKSVVFELDSKAGDTTIKLFDANSNVIYFENIEKLTYSKRFDLKSLKDGVYFFSSEDALKTVTYTINVDKSNVTIPDKVEDTKPVFRKKEDIVYLNFLNLAKGDVKIEVFDSSNRLVFSEKWKDTMIIEKAINFKKAYIDSYTIVVKEGGKAYYETVEID